MKQSNDSTSFPFPSALLAQVQAAAQEEHRPTLEIVKEAIERYLESRHRISSPFTSAKEKARAFEAWARGHPAMPPLPDEALKRENLIRDSH